MKAALVVCFAMAVSANALAQMCGSGWTSYPVVFHVQWPTNAPEDERYGFTNGIYHCLVYSNDGAFQIGNTTHPRTEQRFTPDYTKGEIQYQATLMAPSNENSYCIFQIHTGNAQSPAYGSTTFMLFWFSSDGGSAHDYSGTELAGNLGNRWFQLNVDHNLTTRAIKVWINQKLVWTQQDNGAGDFYFKDGVYEQNHGPTHQMDAYIRDIQMWTRPGSSIVSPPQITSVRLAGGNLVITGGGGPPRGAYVVLASTNLLAPFPDWTRVATNPFDGNGDFSFTNTVNSEEQHFFMLQLP